MGEASQRRGEVVMGILSFALRYACRGYRSKCHRERAEGSEHDLALRPCRRQSEGRYPQRKVTNAMKASKWGGAAMKAASLPLMRAPICLTK